MSFRSFRGFSNAVFRVIPEPGSGIVNGAEESARRPRDPSIAKRSFVFRASFAEFLLTSAYLGRQSFACILSMCISKSHEINNAAIIERNSVHKSVRSEITKFAFPAIAVPIMGRLLKNEIVARITIAGIVHSSRSFEPYNLIKTPQAPTEQMAEKTSDRQFGVAQRRTIGPGELTVFTVWKVPVFQCSPRCREMR